MNKYKLIVCGLLAFLFLAAAGSAAAAGSLKFHGSGLWDYYNGKSVSYVKSHAPTFEKISANRYLLDHEVIGDVELYLTGEFKNDRLVILQIVTPYPDYRFCNESVRNFSYTFATVSGTLMGFDFDIRKECTQEDDGHITCKHRGDFCMFDPCAKEMGYYACSSLKYYN